jgi:hypothetical protein
MPGVTQPAQPAIPEPEAEVLRQAAAFMAEPDPLPAADGVMDFSEDTDAIPFRVAPDEFHAAAMIPAGMALDMARWLDDFNTGDPAVVMAKLGEFLEEVLLDGEAERFVARLRSKEHPIGVRQLVRIIRWLLRQYTSTEASEGTPVPTPAASPSTGGAADSGLSWTGGPLPGVSNPDTFRQIG